MSVNDEARVKVYPYTGAGVYGITFKTYSSNDIRVILINTDGTTRQLVKDTEYTVALLPEDAGADITVITSSYDSYARISISSALPYVQSTDWANGGVLDMGLLTRSFDTAVMMIQQLRDALTAAVATSNWRGDWATGVLYDVKDIVIAENGNWYSVIVYHVSGTFATDLAAGYFILVLDIASLIQEARDAMMSIAADMTAIGERSDAIHSDFYEATEAQTEFVITEPTGEDNIIVFMNSRKLRLDEDYTLNSSVAASLLTLAAGADAGDEIEIISFNTYDLTGLKSDLEDAIVDATAQAAIATTKAGEALGSATDAADSLVSCDAAVVDATAQAVIATTKAEEAAAYGGAITGSNSLLQGSSITSNYIAGTGQKTFITQPGKNFTPGMPVTILRSTSPFDSWMRGTVISYNTSTGSLVVSVSSSLGSGTYISWYILADRLIDPVFFGKLTLTASGPVPASASADGVKGTIIVDADYIYLCTATNTWKRVAVATW